MSDKQASAMTWLAGKLKANASQTILYIRGDQSVQIQATLGKQILRVTDHQGATKVERPDADACFTSTDLDFGQGPTEPEDGDEFRVTKGLIVKRFKLEPVNNGKEPSWHYTDGFETMIRAHGKYIGKA